MTGKTTQVDPNRADSSKPGDGVEPVATKSIPEVQYSHPLTDEDKARIDKLIDSIKRKAKK